LYINGVNVILGADPVELNFYQSKLRVAPRSTFLPDTRDVCER